MKHLLLFLLFSIATFGQVSTGQETPFDYGIQNTAAQLVGNSDYVVTQGNDGTYGKYLFNLNQIEKKQYLSTGLIKNGLLTANADPTKYDITAGVGIISNFDNPDVPTSTLISFGAIIGHTPAYLNTSNITYMAINGSGALVEQASPFTAIQRRSLILIGAVVHSNLTTINSVNNISAPTNADTNQLHDFMEAVGALNISGNKFEANGANLQLNKTAGKIFKLGINFANDWKDPHSLSQIATTALTFRYRTQNGTEGSDVTSINPAVYDLANVLTAVPSNKFSIQTVTLFQTGIVRIQYGQNVYNTLSEAEAAIFTRNYNVEPNIAANGITRAYIIVKNTTTSLQNTSDSKIVEAGKFGSVGGGGGAITLDAIIAALGYTPANDVDVVKLTGNQTVMGEKTFNNLYLKNIISPVFSTVTDLFTAGNLNGTYTYAVTYYNALGESESSGEVTISVVNSRVSVSLPISLDTSVTGRRIYRTIANPADTVIKKLVVDIANNTATSYTDNVLDGSLGVSLQRVNTSGGQLFLNNSRIGFASNLSTSFGKYSFINNTGYADTSFGYGVLTDNTTGYRNTGIGTFALYKNTTGYNNTALGVHALNYNIGGKNNTALGFGTLMNNVSGNSNVAIGESSLNSNVLGNNNVAIGETALQYNLASNNVAIGWNSSKYTNTGSGNIGIGTESLLSNSDGNYNTAIGQSSLKTSNGWFNTSIGYRAAGDGSLGWDNTIVGAQAGLNAGNAGYYNTFIGSQAGYSSVGTGSLFLGNQSGYYETGNNKLFIDNAKRTNQADARVKALIYGQFDASVSNQFLTVNGNLNLGLTPTTSAGTYDILTRNTSTGVVEKVLSNTIATVASPAFTGTPTAPTATVGTNTTQIATTAFVQNAVSSGTYTPTFTNTTNISSSTLNAAYYTRIGNIVTVTIAVQTTLISASATVLTFSLPISGATVVNGIGQGNLTSGGGAVNGYGIVDITNSTTAQLRIGSPLGIGAGVTSITFMYTL